MSFPSLPQPWDVRAVEDGILVKIPHRELDVGIAALLFDDLYELTLEHGQCDLHLDCGAVRFLSSAVLGRLLVLHRKLRDGGSRLSLFNLNPQVSEVLKASLLTDLLDIHVIPLPR